MESHHNGHETIAEILSDANPCFPESEDDEEEENDDEEAETLAVLRRDLLARLQSPQFSSKLKSQIRTALALQLTPGHILTAKPSSLIQSPDPLSDLSNAVVAQHLLTSACDFSLSVFLAESGLNTQLHPMGIVDLMRFLRISYDGMLLGGRGPDKAEQRSFLSFLMERLPGRLEDASTLNRSGEGVKLEEQTIGSKEDLLEERMQMLEIKRRLGWTSEEAFSVAKAFDRYRCDVESSLRYSLRKEMSEKHSSEIHQLVEEEKSRHAREILNITTSWESRVHEQQTTLEKMHERLHLADQEIFTQRQQLLQQHGHLVEREEKLKLTEAERQRDFLAKEQELVQRAKQLADVSHTIEKVVEKKVEDQLATRGRSLDDREGKLRKEETALTKLKEHLTKTLVTEDGDFSSSVSEPKPFLQKIKSEFSRLHRENQQLKNKLGGFGDYDNVRKQVEDFERENRNFRRQVESLQTELAHERQEHTVTVKELTEKMVRPERGIDTFRKEADAAREKLLLETLRWEADKSRLKNSLKDKTREVDGLTNKVAQLQEKIDSLNGKLSRLQSAASQATWMMMQSPTTAPPPHPSPSFRINGEPPAADHSNSDDSCTSLRSIADAKKRIRALEQEANTMQQHFHQYRRYVTDSWTSSSSSNSTHDPPIPFAEVGVAARTSGLILNPAALQDSLLPTLGHPRKVQLTQYILQEKNGVLSSDRRANIPGLVAHGSSSGPVKEQALTRISHENRSRAPIDNNFDLPPRSLHLELRSAAEISRNDKKGQNFEADVAELLADSQPNSARILRGSGW